MLKVFSQLTRRTIYVHIRDEEIPPELCRAEYSRRVPFHLLFEGRHFNFLEPDA